MNYVPRFLAAFAICCIFFASKNEASAQQRGGRRVPHYSRTATVSPYINLFQSRNGGVNNYFTEVRPRLQFQRQINNLQNTNRGVNRQSNLINQQTTILQETIEQTVQMTLRQGRQSQPAAAGRFMNTGRFFPMNGISTR